MVKNLNIYRVKSVIDKAIIISLFILLLFLKGLEDFVKKRKGDTDRSKNYLRRARKQN